MISVKASWKPPSEPEKVRGIWWRLNKCVWTHIKVRTEQRDGAGERQFQTDETAQAEGQPQLCGHEDGTGRNAWVSSYGMMDTRPERPARKGGQEKTRMLNINRLRPLTVSKWHNYSPWIVPVWKDTTSVLKVLGYRGWGLKDRNSMNGGRIWQKPEWCCSCGRLLVDEVNKSSPVYLVNFKFRVLWNHSKRHFLASFFFHFCFWRSSWRHCYLGGGFFRSSYPLSEDLTLSPPRPLIHFRKLPFRWGGVDVF